MSLPPEAPEVRLTRQVLWKETEFDKWAHPMGKQSINKIINVLPIENQASVLPPADKHVVVEQAVEAQIADATVLGCELQVLPPSRP
jgi:hypothetical protein